MDLHDTVSLRFPAKADWVSFAGAAAREYACRIGFPSTDAERICLAVEEAALNAVGFSYGKDDDAIQAVFSRITQGMHLTVRSRGLPLDEDSLPQFDPDRLGSHGDTTGLSSFLIRKVMDKATFSVLDGGEREIAMHKYLPGATGGLGGQAEREGAAPKAGRAVGDTKYAVRLATPGDAEAIARLALESHGTVLFQERIYYPACVREMLETGEMVSAVVEIDGGGLAGHAARVARAPDAKVQEMTFLFVDGRFRGHGGASAMADLLLRDAVARGVEATTILAVANHLHSQPSAINAGFKECGLLLAASPASRAWRGQTGQEAGRITNLALVKRLRPSPAAAMYVPQRHRTMVERIMANQGMAAQFEIAPAADMPQGPSRIEALSDITEGWTMIVVAEYGEDVLSRVGAQLRLSRAEGIPVRHLLLPLGSPATSFLAPEFENMGFFFAGVGPSPDGAENLVFQDVCGVDPGYDAIQLYTPFGRELLEYVRSHDPGR